MRVKRYIWLIFYFTILLRLFTLTLVNLINLIFWDHWGRKTFEVLDIFYMFFMWVKIVFNDLGVSLKVTRT